MALLCVKLFAGKPFVHTHVDGNKALNRRGIFCISAQDAQMRRQDPRRVNERKKKESKR